MSRLFIDIETYSDLDLSKCGVHAYAASSSFDITLIGLAYDDIPVITVLDTIQKKLHTFKSTDDAEAFGVETNCSKCELEILKAKLSDPEVEKIAHNASFEMTCLERYFNVQIYPEQWTDTMALANIAGLPASLGALSEVLHLGEKGKKSIGRQLITIFTKPYSTDKNRQKHRIYPDDDPAKWAEFIKYNRFDIEAERVVYNKLYDITKNTWCLEKPVYCLDHAINHRGIRIDTDFVKSAVAVSDAITTPKLARVKKLTGLSNPNSTPALKQWLNSKGLKLSSLTKDKAEELKDQTTDAEIREVLDLKFQLAKASVKKYDAMLRAECPDERIKGAFQYYGASRSGRWAGRLVQLQNLRRNSIPDLDTARRLVKAQDLEWLEIAYDIPGLDTSEILGQLVRTAFVPSQGNKFIIADFSAIEARVIAWLADEDWRQKVFAHDGDIYKSSYSQAFGVPIEEVDKPMRQKGKIMELALGYGGSVGALKAFGADKLGMDDGELKSLVSKWRKASKNIVTLWKLAEEAAKDAIELGSETEITVHGGKTLKFSREWLEGSPVMVIELPTKRRLYYQDAVIADSKYGKQVSYMDVGTTSRKYERTYTHGGKLVENITQAVARDCLANAMLRLDNAGYKIVAHIHDEVIIDAPMSATVNNVTRIMGLPWDICDGLHLTAHGYEGRYYFKD